MSRVNIRDALRSFISGLDTSRRPIMLDFGADQKALQSALALQHVNIHEGLMSGLAGHLTCVSQPGFVCAFKYGRREDETFPIVLQ